MAMVWEVVEAMLISEQIDKYLADGWEPFGSTDTDGTTYIQLRRQVEVQPGQGGAE